MSSSEEAEDSTAVPTPCASAPFATQKALLRSEKQSESLLSNSDSYLDEEGDVSLSDEKDYTDDDEEDEDDIDVDDDAYNVTAGTKLIPCDTSGRTTSSLCKHRSGSINAFAPPFYGRPPTPLPPSPSLTSLLRPSRPTTPDASGEDTEGGGGGGTSCGSSGRRLRRGGSIVGGSSRSVGSGPVPRANPKVPTYEYYGFVLYLFSTLAFGLYLLWSFLPSPFLHGLGIYYYPNRWWALAIPSFLVMLVAFIFVALGSYNLEILTLGLENTETVVDEAAKVAVVGWGARYHRGFEGTREGSDGDAGVGWERSGSMTGTGKEKGSRHGHGLGARRKWVWAEAWSEPTDAVMDVPLAGVCEVLYGHRRHVEGNGAVTSDGR